MKKHQKIEAELDKIIIAEINIRFAGKRRRHKNPSKIKELIEKKNREIVRTHQRSKTATNLSTLFSGYLEIKEGGRLHFGERDLNKKEFESYLGKKNRLEALLGASLNTLEEEDLISIVYRKKNIFDDEYAKAQEAMELVRQAEKIRQQADEPNLMVPDDEEAAISYLKEIAPLKASLQKTEIRYIEMKEDVYIAEVLQQLQRAINLSFKSINLQTRKASRFLFEQARRIFQHHKSARSDPEELIRQKEALVRYYSIFDSISDENRKKQTRFFISTIETRITDLQKEMGKENDREIKISEKNKQDAETAYKGFLEIKARYAEGQLDTTAQKRRAVSRLKKCQNTLKSNVQRVKAREIERFINATGIDKEEEKEDVGPDAPVQNLFYKRAFLAILPVTIALAALTIYHIHILSGCKGNEADKVAVVEEQKKASANPLAHHPETLAGEDKSKAGPPSRVTGEP